MKHSIGFFLAMSLAAEFSTGTEVTTFGQSIEKAPNSMDSRIAADASETDKTYELDPFVVSASRHYEAQLEAPASVSVLQSEDLLRDGVPSVVTSLRSLRGVDIHQVGVGNNLVAVRGFKNAFSSYTYTMVDQRDSYNPGLGLVYYPRLPIDVLDIERIEVVRGPGSALYGPGVEQGIIHFITKDPFEHPGTSISLGFGTQSTAQSSFRNAGVLNDKFGYKLTGSYMEGTDWELEESNPHDAQILQAIVPEIRGLDGEVSRVLNGRDYGVYSFNLAGQLQYRPDEDTRVTAHADYARTKNILNASLGEIQVDGSELITGQIKYAKGAFFAQAYGVQSYVNGTNWFYRAGSDMHERSSEINLQAQYKMEAAHKEGEPLIFGIDYKRTNPRTKGTVTGRFENDDRFNGIGAYLHGGLKFRKVLEIKASGRLDYIDVTDETVLSPRLALLYKATPERRFRLTYNRALSRPIASDFFGDLKVQATDFFNVRFLGGSDALTFSNPLATTSFVGPGKDTGIGISTTRAYSALLSAVSDYLYPDNSHALQALLLSKTSQLTGFTKGVMLFPSNENEPPRFVDVPLESQQLSSPITETLEIGFNGTIAENVSVAVDAYYCKKKDFVFAHTLTPFVAISGSDLAAELERSIHAGFTDEELLTYGIDVDTLANAFSQTAPSFDGVIGIVEPEQNHDPTTPPEVVLAQLNAGTLDYFGAECSIEAHLSESWTAYANYTWVSDNFFDQKDLGLLGTGFELSMNSPEQKFNLGLSYRNSKGLTLSCDLRHVGEFRVSDGIHYNGLVDSYTLTDLGFNYLFSGSARGLSLAVTAQNVFDHDHREYIGFPKIGRRITSRLSYRF
ncbi:TonB-dependent receptor [Pelagicoccus mobilis]|uniref:TonB-dependent receptor n=1 Tax=Pelagicoccus mobilis TaxID=415221 RepID=A0A934RWN6_9BACT|nr:TonB-dependent receptor [Pelagicoccus mobilis]MBK1875772.1 TonB-dependent receptor [Pelagicoccus mobilis]